MTKLCECGCEAPAPLATMTSRRWGHVKGQPVRFIHGHHVRRPTPPLSMEDRHWLAGLLEGEGSFIVSKRKRTPKTRPAWVQLTARVQVAMKDEDVIARVASLLGVAYHPNAAGLYSTCLDGAHAERLMRELHPLMGHRRQGQIDTVLARL